MLCDVVLSQVSGGTAASLHNFCSRAQFVKAKLANPVVGRITTVRDGADPSLEFRVRFYYDTEDGGKTPISPWHDVPLRNGDGTYNFIVEIPKWSRRKYEIATGEVLNPIKQDVKNGTLREYHWGDMMWNYGALPQTWEDPKIVHPDTGCGGDNDPIDIVELGSRCWATGSIVRVKVLGVLGLIDAGETDWKVSCCRALSLVSVVPTLSDNRLPSSNVSHPYVLRRNSLLFARRRSWP